MILNAIYRISQWRFSTEFLFVVGNKLVKIKEILHFIRNLSFGKPMNCFQDYFAYKRLINEKNCKSTEKICGIMKQFQLNWAEILPFFSFFLGHKWKNSSFVLIFFTFKLMETICNKNHLIFNWRFARILLHFQNNFQVS